MPIVTRAEYAELVRTAFADYAAASLPQTTQRAMEFAEGRGDVDVIVSALHKLHRSLGRLRKRGRRVVGKRGPDELCVLGARDGGHREVFCSSARTFGLGWRVRICGPSAVPASPFLGGVFLPAPPPSAK